MDDPQGIVLDAIKDAWLANKAAEEGLEVFSEVQFGEKSPSEDPDATRGFPYCVISAEKSRLLVVTDVSGHYLHEIVFTVYENTYAAAKTMSNAIWTAFVAGFSNLSDSPLNLASGSLMKVRPIFNGFMREDRLIYSWEIRIEFETKHAR